MAFLNSYLRVFKPLALVMDLLQREEDCYVGHVIPTIIGIQTKLQGMIMEEDTKPLVNALLDGLQTRFRSVFDDDQMHIATMLIPKFKLNYLPVDSRNEKKMMLIHAVYAMRNEAKKSSSAERIVPLESSGNR